MHLIENLGKVFTVNDFGVLNLEKVLTSMAIHVYEDLRALVPLYPLGHWKLLVVPSSNQIENSLICQVLLFIIDFNIVAI